MMYTIVLVDDEKNIIEGLKVIIKGNLPNCELIGTAYNGIEGYQAVLELKPDIVITDIRMPQADGLEMIQSLIMEGCTARFIILSGYSEFEYAKKGIHLGVKCYINKPVEEDELYESVYKIIAEIEAESIQIKELAKLQNTVKSNIESLKEFVLRDILDADSENIREVRYLTDLIDFPASASQYGCVIIELNSESGSLQDDSFEKMIKKINSRLGRYNAVFTFRYIGNQIAIIISDNNKINHSLLINSMEIIINDFFEDFKIVVSIGVGQAYESIEGISKSFEEARHALNYKVIMGTGTIISYKEIEKNSTGRIVIHEEDIGSLVVNIENMDYEACSDIIDDIFRKMALDRNLSLSNLQLQCLNILLSGIRKLSPSQLQLNEYLGKNILSLEGISRFETMEQLKGWLKNTIKSIIELKSIRGIAKKKDIITEIKEYVAENFEKNISLADLSSRFFINPHYLSQLFKEKTGQTYLNYLMQLRVNQSKELLEKSELKVYEICQIVGYTDTTHFSRLFEKFVGCRPSEYRKKLGKPEIS